ncbi:hypothetical protein BD410DRAFT_649404 [Rickenella mellea]|uniref:Uncharacterized protein n=1 Tax=Rickenella mellea TaxID=50990 RepID=A0A4Y7PNN6_9AGAM|nr:hypothetical protein BD410DRAFT_649404 [Rickenella mellea]
MNVWITMTQIGLYSMLILRTFAIYQKNQFILVILGLTAVANVASGLYDSVLGKSEVDSDVLGSTCGEIEVSTILTVLLAEIISSLVFDILLFTLTTAKTIRHTIEMRKVGLGNGLGYFILRDGAMYFLAKLLIGVVGTTIFFVPASGAIGNWLTVLGAISNPLTIILITRLVLNLKQVSHSRNGNSPTHGTIGTIEEPVFATNSFLGNLGAPLRMDPEVDEIEEIGVGDGAESAGL